MKLTTDTQQPSPNGDVLRTDDASRTRYFKEALDALERLWTRKPDETKRQSDTE